MRPRAWWSTEHDGRLPDDLDALLALPGIGPYTARAVLAFAFERDVAVVDTNIARVLARTVGERLTPKRAQAVADELVPVGQGWLWNQAFMDLGAVRVSTGAEVRRVPTHVDVCMVRGRPDGCGPGGRLGRGEHASGAVRGQRPSGPRPRHEGVGCRPAAASARSMPASSTASSPTASSPSMTTFSPSPLLHPPLHPGSDPRCDARRIGGRRVPDLRLGRAPSQRLLPPARRRCPRTRPRDPVPAEPDDPLLPAVERQDALEGARRSRRRSTSCSATSKTACPPTRRKPPGPV